MFDLKSFCEVNNIEMIRNENLKTTIFRKKNDKMGPLIGFLNEMIDSEPEYVRFKLIEYFNLFWEEDIIYE